jgi:hypothetical protein
MSTEVNSFSELLSVLGEEELIRFKYRLRKAGKIVTAEILADELAQRERPPDTTAVTSIFK